MQASIIFRSPGIRALFMLLFFYVLDFPKQVSHLFLKVVQTLRMPSVQYGKKLSLCMLLIGRIQDLEQTQR